jgi:hypothetical protein
MEADAMSSTQTEHPSGSLETYVPFTPFESSYTFEAQPPALATLEQPESAPIVTPFVSEYTGLEAPVSAEAQELRELLHQVYDEELDETLEQIADEAWNAANERAAIFGETAGSASTEQFLEEWINPVRVQAEALIDNVAQALTSTDPATLTEAQLDEIFERFEPGASGLETYFEDFLWGLGKKLKSFANKAIAVAKKGLSLLPIGLLLKQVKRLLRPMFKRVLKYARDKLPPALRPIADQLAQRVFGTTQSEQGEELAAAGPDVSSIQQQFDLEMASLLFAAEPEQEEAVAEATLAAEAEGGPSVAELHEARTRFVEELDKGVAPQEALENFIPAVMAVLPIARTVIGIIGRDKLVKTLAKPLAGFIGRYVDPAASGQLSQAIVDTGLRLVSLEAPTSAEVAQLAPEALAAAVEDTVRRVGELDETTLEHPALFEAAVTEAFHDSAAENFPAQLLIPELHESTVNGTWVSMPLGRRRKYFKKYTRVFGVQITPQIADALKTSRGAPVGAFLKDHLRVTPPVHARVHVYQAIFGTTYGRVARLERGVPGLGAGVRRPSRLFHPLTTAAAGTLLGEPKLGRDIRHHGATGPHRLPVGKRFYYLEIAGARPVPGAGPGATARGAAARSSEVNVTLDFPKDEFRVFAYLSEADAHDIAGKLRQRDVTAALVAGKRIYEAGLTTALSGDIQRHVKILTEDLPHEQLFGGLLGGLTDQIKGLLAKKVGQWVGKAFADYVQARAAEFITATEDPADGVTMVVTIVNPPGAPLVRKLLRGSIGVGDVVGGLDSMFKGDPRVGLQTVPGFRFD